MTSAGHTAVVVDEAPQISEPGHGHLEAGPENNTGWCRLWFFACFSLLQQCACEGARPVRVEQPMAVTSAEHTAVVVDEAPKISEQGHGRLEAGPENNTGWLRSRFFACFRLLQRCACEGAHFVLVQQPVESASHEHPEQGHGRLGFLHSMFRSLARFTLGQKLSDPFWRLILLTAVNLVIAAMIGLVCLPKALHEVYETYNRVMLIMTIVVPIAVAMVTFLATIWIRRNDGRGRSNWITALSVANVTMLAGPLVLYWVLTTYYTGGTRN